MYFSFPPASLLFVHVPRTGGTSVTEALMQQYGDRDAPKNFRKHISGTTLKKNMPPEQWRLAYKFTIVRNPWDRMVSLWQFHKASLDRERGNRSMIAMGFTGNHLIAMRDKIMREPFSWWLLRFQHDHKWIPYRFKTGRRGLVQVQQMRWLTDDLERIFRFEQLSELEQTLDLKLPWLNETEAGNYREHYDLATREWVRGVFAHDIHTFGYSF